MHWQAWVLCGYSLSHFLLKKYVIISKKNTFTTKVKKNTAIEHKTTRLWFKQWVWIIKLPAIKSQSVSSLFLAGSWQIPPKLCAKLSRVTLLVEDHWVTCTETKAWTFSTFRLVNCTCKCFQQMITFLVNKSNSAVRQSAWVKTSLQKLEF